MNGGYETPESLDRAMAEVKANEFYPDNEQLDERRKCVNRLLASDARKRQQARLIYSGREMR